MGFLDRALKKGVSKAISSSISDAINAAAGVRPQENAASAAGGRFCGQCGRELVPGVKFCGGCGAPTGAQPAQTQTPRGSDIRRELSAWLAAELPQYEARANVPASALGVDLAAKPYDYVLYAGGSPAAAIMLTDHNRDNNRAFKNAKAGAERAGVPFVNFYTHMPNERGYVMERIKSFL